MRLLFGSLLIGDLKKDTMTFEMEDPIVLQSGNYAIVKLDSLNDRIALEEFIESKK